MFHLPEEGGCLSYLELRNNRNSFRVRYITYVCKDSSQRDQLFAIMGRMDLDDSLTQDFIIVEEISVGIAACQEEQSIIDSVCPND